LLDFKSNQVAGRSLAQLAAPYELQLAAYALAAETALGAPLASVALHFLRNGEEHVLAWDDATRQRAIALIGQAIEMARQAS
jgi:ATP-dependent exoDNAse (exonuclease V) beta subunit